MINISNPILIIALKQDISFQGSRITYLMSRITVFASSLWPVTHFQIIPKNRDLRRYNLVQKGLTTSDKRGVKFTKIVRVQVSYLHGLEQSNISTVEKFNY